MLSPDLAMPIAKTASRVTKRSQKPSIPLSKVPPIKKLLQLLGFQRASIQNTQSFIAATHSWRNSYATGNSACELRHWNEPLIQLKLKDLANDFLYHGVNGDRFWGAGRSWFCETDMQFPRDAETIISLLMQLFWKQNIYAFNNSQYGTKQLNLGDRSGRYTTASPGIVSPTSSVTNLPSSRTRPKIQIPLWIITYEPSPTRILWTDGKCLGTSLSSFISGISQMTQRSDVKRIKLTLKTPSWNTIITVPIDAEDVWGLAKETFKEALQEAKREAEGKMRDCKILIEPLY